MSCLSQKEKCGLALQESQPLKHFGEVDTMSKKCAQSKEASQAKARSAHAANPRRTICYHIYSLWLFTVSDLKTILIPKTAFGLFILLSGPLLTISQRPRFTLVLQSLPLTTLWVWINLLPLDMNNQQGSGDIAEDTRNKPWRPIPAGRLTVNETRVLVIVSYIIATFASYLLGGLTECVVIAFEGWVYNQLGAANDSYIARNILNAMGYMTFAAEAAKVA